jgi:hypothetical protein
MLVLLLALLAGLTLVPRVSGQEATEVIDSQDLMIQYMKGLTTLDNRQLPTMNLTYKLTAAPQGRETTSTYTFVTDLYSIYI